SAVQPPFPGATLECPSGPATVPRQAGSLAALDKSTARSSSLGAPHPFDPFTSLPGAVASVEPSPLDPGGQKGDCQDETEHEHHEEAESGDLAAQPAGAGGRFARRVHAPRPHFFQVVVAQQPGNRP